MVEVIVVPKEDFRKEAKRYFEDVSRGSISDSRIVMDPKRFAKVFSPKRLAILMELRDSDLCISELARKLDRCVEAVYRDLKVLSDIGLVLLEQGERNSLIPKLVGEIRMSIPA